MDGIPTPAPVNLRGALADLAVEVGALATGLRKVTSTIQLIRQLDQGGDTLQADEVLQDLAANVETNTDSVLERLLILLQTLAGSDAKS